MAQRGGGGRLTRHFTGNLVAEVGHAPYRYHRTAVRAVNGARTRRIRGITCAVARPLRLRKGKGRFRGVTSEAAISDPAVACAPRSHLLSAGGTAMRPGSSRRPTDRGAR